MEAYEVVSNSIVEVVYSPAAREVVCVKLDLQKLQSEQLSHEVTVKDCIVASGLLEQFPDLNLNQITVGVWGKKMPLEQTVKVGDRIEIYRKLLVDPKEARRLRYQKQDVKRSSLVGSRKAFKST